MSLWTPDGEHRVPRDPQPRPEPEPAQGSSEGPGDSPAFDAAEPDSIEDLPGFDELTPEQQAEARAMAAELAEAQRRIAETPAAEVVANHVMGLYELGAIHLSSEPPAIEQARVAIDAMAAVVGALQGRLGQNEAVLREALQQIQLAFVQRSNAE